MKAIRNRWIGVHLWIAVFVMLGGCAGLSYKTAGQIDRLPSWNDGPAKAGIVDFVQRVTEAGSPDFVPPDQRITVFDNDGTLWVEQPLYTQMAFAVDRIRILARQHPQWRTTQPFAAVLEDDPEALRKLDGKAWTQLIVASHTGMTTAAFKQIAADWLATARHPRFRRPYTELVYQPMRELLDYLRAGGFKTYIVSGGGIDFIRVFAEKLYGIPPEQVIGSSFKTKFVLRDGRPAIMRLPAMDFFDNRENKPVGINLHIGRRPIAAFGNSDGDLAMLQWTAASRGTHLCLYVHHTDARREWDYDRDSSIGRLDKGLREARARGWIIVDMARDWNRVFPFEGH
jgi:phosphoglycolate phosphatase-like HAD superfamily hydrolase